jgi:MtrB/PioB family decaheme-associated outer membrane protein
MDSTATARERETWKHRLVCLVVAGAWLLPAAAAAQEDAFTLEADKETRPSDPEAVRELTEVQSEAEIGIGSVSRDSYRFGRYTGLEEQGAFGVLDIEIRRRGSYDGDSARYWNFSGSNLGLTSRGARFEYGVQGHYGMMLEYDQIPTFRSDTAQTIFDGAGSTNLTLPTPWTFGPDGADSGTVAGDATDEMADLNTSLKDVNIDHERRRLGFGVDKRWADTWAFKTRFTHETKEGLKTVGAVIGNSGGNPRAVLIPEPVDYVTRQLDATLSYADRKKQVEIGYSLSLFNDRNESLTWQNPYSAVAGWDASAGYPTGQGQLHLPPDNQFHQVTASGGYNLSDTTRVTADLALGRMIQDQAFLPYTVNPALAASALPRTSLDGWIDTTLLNLRIASRPAPKLSMSAGYRYDDRDNKTPRDEYVYIGGDSQTQDTSATSLRRRFNEPYSYQDHQLKLDAGYQLFRWTDLTVGAERKETERTYSEREEATEDTYRVGLKGDLTETVSTGIRLSRAGRHGSTYRGEAPFLSTYAPGYTATVPGGWENHPDMRKYFLSDRQRDTVVWFAALTPGENWAVGVNATYLRDDYERSEMGLTGSTMGNYTVDASYHLPSAAVTTYAFYTYEHLRSDQDGLQFSGGAVKLTQASDPARDWSATHRDRMDTIGGGVAKTLIKNTLDLGADYVYAKSKSEVDVTAGSSLTTAPLPVSITRLNSLSVYGKYTLRRDMALKARYWIEKFRSTDWAADNVDPNTLANVITLGEDSPGYTVHVLTISFVYRF